MNLVRSEFEHDIQCKTVTVVTMRIMQRYPYSTAVISSDFALEKSAA